VRDLLSNPFYCGSERYRGEVLPGIEVAAAELEKLTDIWQSATDVEKAKMVRLTFDSVWVDLDAVEVVKKRPALRALMQVLRDDAVLTGDPERPRVNREALYRPVIALVEAGSAAPYAAYVRVVA
jgi:hypothetical protein